MIHFLEGIPAVLDWLLLRIGVKDLKDPGIFDSLFWI